MKARMAGLLLCAFVAVTITTRAEAQGIGGLVKKKVEEAKKGETKAADAQDPAIHTTDVLPITSTLLDGFMTGLNTEIRLRKEFQQVLASFKTPEQYKSCSTETAMSEEGQKILGQLGNLPDSVTAADIQRVMEKMDVEMKALLKKRCGDDVGIEWPNGKRAEKLEEIEAKAAAAVDPSKEPNPELDNGPSDASVISETAAAGINVRAYQILKERLIAFCAQWELGNIKLNGQPVSFPGSGSKIYWVYTAQEAALIAAHCKQFMAALEQLL